MTKLDKLFEPIYIGRVIIIGFSVWTNFYHDERLEENDKTK